jgi:hypothetical protein
VSLASRPVRPRTRAGRLAALDAWLCVEARELLDGRGALLDVGYGLEPVTTLELARAVRVVTPGLRVVGLEREVGASAVGEPGRSTVARESRDAELEAAAGLSSELELRAGDFSSCAAVAPAAVVRAMNVLRGYREEEVPAIHAALAAPLVDGGLVLEGSTDTEGAVTVVHLLRRRGAALTREALLFHTDFSRGFSPWLFRDWLPRDLRRRVRPGTAIHGFLEAWAEHARGAEPRERFVASLDGVAGLETTAWERAHGFARWAPVGGVPRPA